MEMLKCIVHYLDQKSYSNIKNLSEVNITRITEARKKREELGGDNVHHDRILQIPDVIDPEAHGIHLEPCYKR